MKSIPMRFQYYFVAAVLIVSTKPTVRDYFYFADQRIPLYLQIPLTINILDITVHWYHNLGL